MIQRLFWDSELGRLRMLWRLLLHVLLLGVFALGASLGAGVLLSGLGFTNVLETLANPDVAPPSPLVNSIAAVGTLLVFTVGVWLSGRWLDRRRFADFGLHFNRRWWRDLGFGLALGGVLMTLIFLIEWAAGWITITGVWQAPPGASFGAAILAPLVLFLCVGIYEELWSRGYLLTNFAEGFGFLGKRAAVVIALVLSSAVFGLLHAMNPNATAISTFNLVLAGLFLGLGYVRTGELAIPIGLHITWNFFQGNVYGFPVSGNQVAQATVVAIQQGGDPLVTGGAFGPEAGLMGIGAMVVGSAAIWWWTRGSTGLLLPTATTRREAEGTPVPSTS